MDESFFATPIHRLFSQTDADRTDELGFLDPARTPRLVQFDAILAEPLAWILGPPWIGKSTTVADPAFAWLRSNDEAFDGRVALSRLGEVGVEHSVPPNWWNEWRQQSTPGPAIWLIDGVDEAPERNPGVLEMILHAIQRTSIEHRSHLRLILLSRPQAELGKFRDQLQDLYAGLNSRMKVPRFWLTRLDRGSAERLVGAERFPNILEAIQRNHLKAVAGYPVVLSYLARYPQTATLSVREVWRGILVALLGERNSIA